MLHQQNNPVGDKREQKQAIIQVTGMMCASCVRHIENALLGRDGIFSVSVSLRDGQVTVGYSPARVSPEDIKRKIEEAGYKVMKASTEEH